MTIPTYSKDGVQKSLYECSFDECLELKGILWDKYTLLASIGKGANAYQFMQMIEAVEERIGAIQLDLARAEAEKAKVKAEEQANAEPSIPGRPTGHRKSVWTRFSSTRDELL